MAGKLSKQGYTNFPKILQSSQNSRCQKDNIKYVSHCGPTNIRCHGTKVSCPCNMAPGIRAPLCPQINGQAPLTTVVASNKLYNDTNVHCGNQGVKWFYPGTFTTKTVALIILFNPCYKTSLSLSLSLYIYIYIYTHTHTHIHTVE